MNHQNAWVIVSNAGRTQPWVPIQIWDTMNEITWKISGCLSGDLQKRIAEIKEAFFELLWFLQDEMKRKRAEIHYDLKDYNHRLSQSDEFLQKVFEEIMVTDEKIREVFESLLWTVEGEPAKEVLKQKLFEEYFSDLVYESMEKIDYENMGETIKLTEENIWKIKEIGFELFFENLWNTKYMNIWEYYLVLLNQSTCKDFFENIGNILNGKRWVCYFVVLDKNVFRILSKCKRANNFDLSSNNLAEFDNVKLKFIFKNLRNVKNINLSNVKLHKFNEEQLQIVFHDMRNVKKIDLSWNRLNEMDDWKLKFIFENLRNVKDINLSDVKLHKFNEKQLQIVFHDMRNVKKIDLSWNRLNEMDDWKFKIIFENLENVKSIDLSQTELYRLNEKQLKTIFENLKSVKCIDLSYNYLGELDEKRLQIIFEKLQNIEKIYVSEPAEFLEKIITMFPHLKDKIVNRG